jgi:uncharacterized repeat protein (TIGR01451 family)
MGVASPTPFHVRRIADLNVDVIHKYMIMNILQWVPIMSLGRFRSSVVMLVGVAAAAVAADPISVKAIAEVESRITEHGREVTRLAPADRLVSGDAVIYTLEVRNTVSTAVHTPTVTFAVPQYLSYVAESAVGPGAETSFSVDGGRSFDAAENLTVQDADGRQRPAGAADYTHIRWQLKNTLKGNSVAFVRFRARVK